MNNAPIGHDFGDGVFHKVAIELPDGSYGIASIDLDTLCGPTCICEAGQCPELPDNIKLTLSGRFTLREESTYFPVGFEPATDNEEHDVMLPETTISLSRTGGFGSGTYQSTINCDLPVHGSATRLSNGYVQEYGGYGVLNKLVGVTVDAFPFDPGDPSSSCVLMRISLQIQGVWRDRHDGVPVVLNAFYTAQYHSLYDPVLGFHGEFGTSVFNPPSNGVVPRFSVSGITDEGSVLSATCTEPPFYTTQSNGESTDYTSSCTAFDALIEAYEGPPICDSNPFVKADRCDGTGSPITVDVRDALPDVQSSPKLGEDVYRLNGDTAAAPSDTDLWVEGLCPSPPQEYRVYERCNDPSDTILVDEAGKPADALTAFINGDESLKYKPTSSTAFGTETLVGWSLDGCPITGDEQLWERCRIDGEFYTPSGFLPPNRIRVSNEVTNSTVIRATIAGPYYDSPPNRQCRDFASVHYHLISDDGGSYLTHGSGIPVFESCGTTQDRYIRSLCTGSPSDPGDPTDPPGNDLTDPARPQQPNPMQQQIDQFINPNCPSCGG